MATLREIRNQLRSVENIKKITQAMEMVAASRLRRSQTKTENARPYLEELDAILNALLAASTDLTHPLIEQRPVKKIGVVIVAGDRGLCGSYNNNVFSAAKKFLKPYASDDTLLFLVGQKTINHFSNQRWTIADRIADWGNKITFDQIKAFTDQLIHHFLNQLFDEVWLVYTHFETIMKQTVKIEKLLPIKIPEPDLNGPRFDYIFEPNEQEIFNEILGRYCLSKVQSVLNEALTSEFAARIVAMRAATKNAEEMIEDLTLVRNKVRQTGITKELIEITSGANHLKSSF